MRAPPAPAPFLAPCRLLGDGRDLGVDDEGRGGRTNPDQGISVEIAPESGRRHRKGGLCEAWPCAREKSQAPATRLLRDTRGVQSPSPLRGRRGKWSAGGR